MALKDLPVPVRDHPYWRVVFRPASFKEERIETLKKCWDTVEHARVRLRGRDYPHVSNRDTERAHGPNWIASWSDFMNQYEYWRLYQSGQFLHLFSVREATEPDVREEMLKLTKSHLSYMKGVDWKNVPGFVHITNFIYTMTEIFEFAARLAQRGIYDDDVNISVQLHGVRGFVLTTDWNRAWHSYYAVSEDVLGRSWDIRADTLMAQSAEKSLAAVLWFFERFGWLDAPAQILKQDQQNFLSGRR